MGRLRFVISWNETARWAVAGFAPRARTAAPCPSITPLVAQRTERLNAVFRSLSGTPVARRSAPQPDRRSWAVERWLSAQNGEVAGSNPAEWPIQNARAECLRLSDTSWFDSNTRRRKPKPRFAEKSALRGQRLVRADSCRASRSRRVIIDCNSNRPLRQ